MIPCNILRAVKLPNPFLMAENQDSRKSCKMGNLDKYNLLNTP